MGFTPLAGLVMGTRCGDIDPYIPLYICKTQNKTPDEVNEILNKKAVCSASAAIPITAILKRFTASKNVLLTP